MAKKMLPGGWAQNALQKRRAQNFFYQGSIGWWMGDILVPTLRWALFRIKESTPLFDDAVDKDQRALIIEAVERLCEWEVWSTDDEEDLKAMRSNTVKNVRDRFKKYDDRKLIREISKGER